MEGAPGKDPGGKGGKAISPFFARTAAAGKGGVGHVGRRKFALGDSVIIPYQKRIGEKESDRHFSWQVYTIDQIRTEEKPYLFKLRDGLGKKLPRLYYAQELKKVEEPERYPVSKVKRTKMVRGQKFALVSCWIMTVALILGYRPLSLSKLDRFPPAFSLPLFPSCRRQTFALTAGALGTIELSPVEAGKAKGMDLTTITWPTTQPSAKIGDCRKTGEVSEPLYLKDSRDIRSSEV